MEFAFNIISLLAVSLAILVLDLAVAGVAALLGASFKGVLVRGLWFMRHCIVE